MIRGACPEAPAKSSCYDTLNVRACCLRLAGKHNDLRWCLSPALGIWTNARQDFKAPLGGAATGADAVAAGAGAGGTAGAGTGRGCAGRGEATGAAVAWNKPGTGWEGYIHMTHAHNCPQVAFAGASEASGVPSWQLVNVTF